MEQTWFDQMEQTWFDQMATVQGLAGQMEWK
jgi:hypothetical protein